MLRFGADLCFSFHILLTVDLYTPWRRSGRDARMIIILTRFHKIAVRLRSGGGIANPTQTLHELFEIEANSTFTLFILGIIHASIHTEATTPSKSRWPHVQKFEPIHTLQLISQYPTKFLQGSTSDSVKTPSLECSPAYRIFSYPSHGPGM